ncbi:hypothetical protein OSTOST_25955 [Ostertagia ostertagi]
MHVQGLPAKECALVIGSAAQRPAVFRPTPAGRALLVQKIFAELKESQESAWRGTCAAQVANAKEICSVLEEIIP